MMDTLSAITLWRYQESTDELKNKLWTTICELEEVKNNAREEIRKKEDSINQLIELVKVANQERDEARDQLHLLLNKLNQPNSGELLPAGSPHFRPALGSSDLTESENLTDPYNNPSHVSSPTVVDSFVDASISPDLSIPNFDHMMNVNFPLPKTQEELMKFVFDRLAKKPLPEKGSLLKAVIDAGPILDTLFVAGSLPRWRNPPPLKPLLIPPMSIRGDYNSVLNCNVGSPMTNYSVDALCKDKRPLMEHCGGGQQCLPGKRQKSQ